MLSLTKLTSICESVMRDNMDITYSIKASQSTESYYIELVYNKVKTTVRVSGHSTTSKVKSVVTKKGTSDELITRTLRNALKGLRSLSLKVTLGMVELRDTTKKE